jgi:hexosaminidase
MKYLLLALFFVPEILAAQSIQVIPEPAIVITKQGLCDLKQGMLMATNYPNPAVSAIAQQLTKAITTNGTGTASAVTVELQIDTMMVGTESYHLHIASDSILIEAPTNNGLFYGCQTLKQLLAGAADSKRLPVMEIYDSPQYVWRGLEIDVSRHFFDKEIIKQYIDLLARLKMNVFHWHLTDDQGWRIEIKKYPKLTETGAWRIEKDGSRYGGYYTQEDIREVVAYAAERYITIVPEIELPGHSSAAIAAYPQLSCKPNEPKKVPNRWGILPDIYCPSEFTFQFMRDVLDEVCALFPGGYIHLGGDEAPKAAWRNSDVAQALIKKENLKGEEELQHYVLKQMEDYLATKGKTVIGWGEIVRGGLSDSVIVMSWIDKNAGVKAVKNGNRVIMTPRFFCYFDYPATIKDKKGAWYMTYLPVKKVYSFTPLTKAIETKSYLVLGGQANVWTEHIKTPQQLQHQIMPRLAAMAEALWTKPEARDYKDFEKRLAAMFP